MVCASIGSVNNNKMSVGSDAAIEIINNTRGIVVKIWERG
jgi:hypothetical protein